MKKKQKQTKNIEKVLDINEKRKEKNKNIVLIFHFLKIEREAFLREDKSYKNYLRWISWHIDLRGLFTTNFFKNCGDII